MIQDSPRCPVHEAEAARLHAEIDRLEAENRRAEREIAANERHYRVQCAERMRLWIRSGRLPHELLRIMEREKRAYLANTSREQTEQLTAFLDLGITEARSEGRLLYSPA